MGTPERFTAVNGSIFPVPESGRVPTKILFLVHVNVEPGMLVETKFT
jgi:hypothetical protein